MAGGTTRDQSGSLGEGPFLGGTTVQTSSSLSVPVALPAEASPASCKKNDIISCCFLDCAIGLLPRGGRQATAFQKKQSAVNASFAPLLQYDDICKHMSHYYKLYIYKKIYSWAPLASNFTALVQGLRATKTAVSVGVLLYRKWRYQPSQWRHCFPPGGGVALALLLWFDWMSISILPPSHNYD